MSLLNKLMQEDINKSAGSLKRGRKPLSQDDLERGRNKIVEAAKILFLEQGYQSVSMRGLARSINLSPTSLYRFYPNKRAILIHIWGELFDELFRDCRGAAAGGSEPQSALVAYANCFVDYWVANPKNYMMVYGEIDQPKKGESFFADSEMVATELAYLAELLAKCGIANDNIELTLQQLICIMQGVCHSLVTIPELNWKDAHALTGGLVENLLGSK